MINIGNEAQISIEMTIGQNCPFLVQYLETFYHKNFCCLVMEYCELGDLQKELDSGKQYEEFVIYLLFDIYMYFFFF
jgi:serine/threonine protein kinase